MFRKFYVYVDDIRDGVYLTGYTTALCRTYSAAIDTIKEFVDSNTVFALDLDHDLGEDRTGYDICKYLVENNIKVEFIVIHTKNPVGRDNMVQLLTRYGYEVYVRM